MEIIVSHQLTDLDGLAAMVAATKIYPEARPVFVGRLHQLVKDFMALYRDEFNILDLDDVDLSEVSRVIICDTSDQERLGPLQGALVWEEVEVILYDHHPHGQLDWVDQDNSQEVGSVTTILIKEIMSAGSRINPIEATLYALGIYADTGNFAHLNTTAADLEAAAYLLKNGAKIKIINRFLQQELDSQQKQALSQLIPSRQDLNYNGVKFSIFSVKLDSYVQGLNKVIARIKELYHLPTVFILAEEADRVDLIGRSSDEAVDIGKICDRFGGGGHPGAGSAQLEMNLANAEDKLKAVLKTELSPRQTVRSIMSSPVRTVSPDTTIAEAEEILEKYGHNGLVVVDGEDIVGIFSRRDLDKVKGHDLMNAPVRAYMSREVVTISVDASIQEAREELVRYNIGRLPVLEDGRMVGIITRTDLLDAYYSEEVPQQFQYHYGSSLVEIETRKTDITGRFKDLTPWLRNLFQLISSLAAASGNRIFIVGGMVRDFLLGRENRDLDLVIEGEVEPFLEQLAHELDAHYQYNERFQTGSILIGDNYSLDLARTRSEYYPAPGSLPEVEKAGILEDLFRRDFTINALAIALFPDEFGYLYDYFNGSYDLETGLVRVLHRFSFLDDPTRIIRGLKLLLSLDFKLEEETEALMQEALRQGDFSGLSLNRAFRELKDFLIRFHAHPRLPEELSRLPVFKLLDYGFEFDQETAHNWKSLENSLAYLRSRDYNIKEWEVKLIYLLRNMPPSIRSKLNLTSQSENLFNFIDSLPDKKDKIFASEDTLTLARRLDRLDPEELALLHFYCKDKYCQEHLEYYLRELRHLELKVDGNDLIKMGLTPGPEISEVLNEVRRRRYQGRLKDREEQLEYARELVAEYIDEKKD